MHGNENCLLVVFYLKASPPGISKRGSATFDSVSVCFFLFPTGSHITKEDGMGWEKFSYAKWGTNEFKSGKYSNRSSQRLEISIFLINKESLFLLSLNSSTTVTKVETHNDCIVRLWHILWHILQRNKSFFLPFLLVGPEIHNSTHSFLFYDILNFAYNIFLKISVFK